MILNKSNTFYNNVQEAQVFIVNNYYIFIKLFTLM